LVCGTLAASRSSSPLLLVQNRLHHRLTFLELAWAIERREHFQDCTYGGIAGEVAGHIPDYVLGQFLWRQILRAYLIQCVVEGHLDQKLRRLDDRIAWNGVSLPVEPLGKLLIVSQDLSGFVCRHRAGRDHCREDWPERAHCSHLFE